MDTEATEHESAKSMRPMSMGLVRLRVRDLGLALTFYRDLLELGVVREEGPSVWLAPSGVEGLAPSGAEGPAASPDACEQTVARTESRSVLRLDEDRDAPRRPSRTTGLFHIALRVPDRRSLAAVLARVVERRGPLLGASDHAVSEALYLQDPEGNGIEIYADRPRSAWHERDGELYMTTAPLELQGLLAELEPGTDASHPAPRTLLSVGHIHLQVSDLAAAERFYAGVLVFDVTVRSYPGALFLSTGGYHHHVAVNVWSTSHAPRPPAGAAGLVEFVVVTGETADEQRLEDPDGHIVVVRSLLRPQPD